MAQNAGHGSSEELFYQELVDVVKTLNDQGNKFLNDIDSHYDSCLSWLDDVLEKAVEIFSSPELTKFPKTPNVRKTKKRSQLRNDSKENKARRRNSQMEGDASSCRRITRASRMVVKEEIAISPPLTRASTRLTRAQLSEIPPPQNISNSKAITGKTTNEINIGAKTDCTSNHVQEKVKAYESIIKDSSLSPTKAKRNTQISPVTPKMFVSILSPVVLSDSKLNISPRVVCSPLKLDFANGIKASRKSTRQSKCRQRASNAKQSLGILKSTLGHIQPLKRRSSVLMCKIRKSLAAAEKKRSNLGSVESSIVELVDELESCSEEEVPSTESESVPTTEPPSLPKPNPPAKLVSAQTSPMSEQNGVENDSDEEEEESDKEYEVIAKTPSPIHPKPMAKKGPRIQRSSSCRRPMTRARHMEYASSEERRSRPALSASKARNIRTPSSANRASFNRTPNRFVSPKLFQEAISRQRREDMEKKEEKEKQTLRRRQERLKLKIEEQKRKREIRMQRALEKRRHREEQQIQAQEKLGRDQEARSASKDRMKAESQKKSDRLKQKAAEAEERRLQEEEIKKKKLKEKEEEQIKFQELLKRKKEHEEASRRERLMEQVRIQEERNKKRELEKQLEQKKIFEIEQQRLREQEKEKKTYMDRQKLKEAQRNADELLKIKERERMQREKLELEKIRERELKLAREQAEKEKPADNSKTVRKMNVTFCEDESTTEEQPNLNSTYTTDSQSSKPTSYEITPERRREPIPLLNPDNYDISNLHSDDPTDDESNPKKFVPNWAKGNMLKMAVIMQATKTTNLDELFPPFDPPRLELIFRHKRSRFHQRTSSANWSSPILSHLTDYGNRSD